MRRHGWGGELPADDEDARLRIVDAARVIVRATGVAPTITEVASALSVGRPTVYRYFVSAEALLLAAASEGTAAFLDDILARIETTTDAAEAVVEGVAFTFEEIDRRTELGLLLASGRGGSRELTSAAAIDFGRAVLEATAVDWPAAGFGSDAEIDALVQFMLRMLQSLVTDPGDPPLEGPELRAYLRRWVAPAVDEATRLAVSNASRAKAPAGGAPR